MSMEVSKQSNNKKRPREPAGEDSVQRESNKFLSHVTAADIQSINASDHPWPVSRAFTRIVMHTWGWPLSDFKDHLELITAIRDAVEGT